MAASIDDLASALVDAIRAELAALDSEDPDAIQNATAIKAAALAAVQAAVAKGAAPPRPLLEQARDLNSEAILRSRAKLISVERRLVALRPPGAALRAEAITYGRDGRWA
ncbi:hypothetical protein [Sandarakinorhabdus sp.]|uniref:hypothetical protein n=1 Tax=Sandarakinorhabdus sp. TaxID=1916663 RepID=UPI003F70378E